MVELNVKVGDEVIYHTSGFFSKSIITTVKKVTPSGRIRVAYNPDIMFDKYGREMGNKNSRYRLSISECSKEQKEKILKEETVSQCVSKIMEEKDNLTYKQAKEILTILINKENATI